MRLLGLALALMLMALSPAQAAWEQRVFRDEGFAVTFPDEPQKSTAEYRAGLVGRVPATVYKAMNRGMTFSVTIVDVANKRGNQASILQEAIYIRTRGRNIVSDDLSRAEPGATAAYGRRITEDLMDGSRTVTAIYLTKDRLYIFEALIPAGGDKQSPLTGRFIDSVVFNLDRDWNVVPQDGAAQ
jgi:hypothetical protein